MAGQLDLWNMLARHERFSRIAAHRAALSARLIEQIGLRVKNSWGWPLDESGQIEPDLWTGMLGPACALALFQRGDADTLFCPNTFSLASQGPGGRNSYQKFTEVLVNMGEAFDRACKSFRYFGSAAPAIIADRIIAADSAIYR